MTRVRIRDPLQWVGCYTLDVYCDHRNDEHYWSLMSPGAFAQYTGNTLGDCMHQARADGWVFHQDRTATCPLCTRSSR